MDADTKEINDKLDRLIRVVDRTELHVENLLAADSGNRLTKLETKSSTLTWGAVVVLPLMFGRDYIVKLFGW
jgi:hypothetical protein